ncbi:hypothetical protein LSTR_LSTR002337 [Laodelphax striatellus]|uniref:Prefoldin subunit 3 n=1 Tax=Laodelphax striatellus TaxID=195883 RepID=A0A482X253_LAOST|nr:hypothetical protein LSTR_LSTR002337 [Laodelphax striatellus]
MEGDKEIVTETDKKKSFAGIPEAFFVDDVDVFMAKPENAGPTEAVIRKLDEQLSKYKFMEYNLSSKKRGLKSQIPDLEKSVDMINMLKKQQAINSGFDTQFLLSEQVFMKATVPPTDKVCLWMGANVMLEYTLDDALALLKKNINTANKNLGCVENDLDFLRDQITTMEVNMARVHNWDVKRRQAIKATS